MLMLRGNLIYEQVVYENEATYQAIVEQYLVRAWEEYAIIPFTPFVTGDEGVRRRPDIAAIHRKLRAWYVIEVELFQHSLHGHVQPQIAAFATGKYEDEHAAAIATYMPEISENDISSMVRRIHPETVIVVDSASVVDRGWKILEREYGTHLTFLEVFRATDGDPIALLSGFRPSVSSARIAYLKKHPLLNALTGKFLVHFRVPASNKLIIEIEQKRLECTAVTTGDELLLFPPAFLSIAPKRNYELLADDANRLQLRLS